VEGNGNGRKKRRKRIIIWSSIAVVVLALVVTGVVIASTGNNKIDPSKLAKVERGDLAKSVVATGKITPITEVEVKSITAIKSRRDSCLPTSIGMRFKLASIRRARNWKPQPPVWKARAPICCAPRSMPRVLTFRC